MTLEDFIALDGLSEFLNNENIERRYGDDLLLQADESVQKYLRVLGYAPGGEAHSALMCLDTYLRHISKGAAKA